MQPTDVIVSINVLVIFEVIKQSKENYKFIL